MKISGMRLLKYFHKLDLDHKLNKKDKRINTKALRVRIRRLWSFGHANSLD